MMTNNETGSAPDDGSTNRAQRRVVAAGLVIAAIVVLGVVLTITNLIGGNSKGPATSSPAPSTSTTPTKAAVDSTASVCGLSDVQLTGTVATAPMATWALVGTIAAPSIDHQGPGTIGADGYRSCYARTPTGALLAAANYAALGSYAPLRREFYERATVPGSGRDALLRKPIQGESGNTTRIQISGFRVLRYTGNQADIDLALHTSTGAYGAVVLYLEWSGGDWKLRVAEDGSDLSPVSQIPSLAGYIPWAGA